MPVDVSVVVVTWNGAEMIGECLSRLFTQTRRRSFEVYVVDNASTDDTVDVVRGAYGQAKLICNDTNVGFAAANNQALRLAGGRYFLLQNQDAMVVDDAVDSMVEFMDANPRIGVLGPRLLDPDGSLQRSTAGAFPSLLSAASYFFLLDRIFPSSHLFRSVFGCPQVGGPTAVDWISGASCLLRAEAVRQVGLLDESYFMYMEDVDLCYRMKQQGWQVYYFPESRIVHYVGHNTRHQQQRVSSHSIRNFNAYFRRRHGLAATLLLRAMELLGFGARTAAYRLGSRLTGSPQLATLAHLHWQLLKLSWELPTS